MKIRAKRIWENFTEEQAVKALVYYCNLAQQVHHNCEHDEHDFDKAIRPCLLPGQTIGDSLRREKIAAQSARVRKVADEVEAIYAAHDEGASMDAGFDGGEFSVPAHSRMAEREVRELCEKRHVLLDDVENELMRREHANDDLSVAPIASQR